MAIGVLTATPSVPAGTRILPKVPSSTASTSIVALSVSISAITSPERTASPSCFTQRARLPSVIVGDRAGISIGVGIEFSLRAGSARVAFSGAGAQASARTSVQSSARVRLRAYPARTAPPR